MVLQPSLSMLCFSQDPALGGVGDTALMLATLHSHHHMLAPLVCELGFSLLQHQNSRDETVMHYACSSGSLCMVQVGRIRPYSH